MTVRLSEGAAAPDFTLPDAAGRPVARSDFAGRRLVLFCYPAALTQGCTRQAAGLRDRYADLQAGGYDVVGISPDPPGKLRRFAEQESLPYPLLSDPGHEVLEAYGAYGEKVLYGRTVTGVIRSTFVLDGAGRVERAWYNVRATGHADKVCRELKLS